MLVWQLEDLFSTAYKNLCDWLRMLCLRASDHVWIDISQVMTSQNDFIYTVFQYYDCYILLRFLVEFYIILSSAFILLLLHIYTMLAYGDKQTLIRT